MLVETEQINPYTVDIDIQDGYEIARLINNEDQKVANAVAKILPQIGKTIEIIAKKMRLGGRVAYFGSGTSGRIGILDASEIPPTFGTPKELFQAFISGGDQALRYAVENTEDSEEFAQQDFTAFNPQKNDIIVAISASGNPTYTLKILQLAQQQNILTIAISSNPEAKFKKYADIFLNPLLGPEVIVGSSRMKSGTAQKLILNMLSTGTMIKLGKTYHNYMIDLQISNQKLRQRAQRFVCEITGADPKTAEQVLAQTRNIKIACVMIAKNCAEEQAEKLLRDNDGILRRVL